MSGEEKKRRKVLIVSNTGNDSARRFLAHALEVERGCHAVSTTADELFDDAGAIDRVDAVLFDDVNPAECPRARKLLVTLLRLHPPIKSLVVLVGEEDWDNVAEAIRHVAMCDGRVYVHPLKEPLGECLDFLAGRVMADQAMSHVVSEER